MSAESKDLRAEVETWDGPGSKIITIGDPQKRRWDTHPPIGMELSERDALTIQRWLNDGGLRDIFARCVCPHCDKQYVESSPVKKETP